MGFSFTSSRKSPSEDSPSGATRMMKEKLSPTPKNAPMNRFRDNNTKRGGRLDTSVLRTNAAGTDVIV